MTCVLAADSLKVHEDEDNLVIIHVVRDTLRLIQNKFLPAVCSWVQVGQACGQRVPGRARGREGGCPAC